MGMQRNKKLGNNNYIDHKAAEERDVMWQNAQWSEWKVNLGFKEKIQLVNQHVNLNASI